MNNEEQTISEILALDHHETKLRLIKLHAKQTAVSFAEWIMGDGWVLYPGSVGVWADINTEGRVATTTDLYSLYLKSLEV